MRFLAVVERKNLMGKSTLRLISREVGAHRWLPDHREIEVKLPRGAGVGQLLVGFQDDTGRIVALESAPAATVAIVHELSNHMRRREEEQEEVVAWRTSLALQSEELSRREEALSTAAALDRAQLALPPAPEERALLLERATPSRRRKLSVNVMKRLVERAFEEQIGRLPAAVQARIDRTDVEVWALNRLPAYYATGKRGTRMLEEHILATHHAILVEVVREGIAVVLRNEQPPDEPTRPEGLEATAAVGS